jgi:hypothetical protein
MPRSGLINTRTSAQKARVVVLRGFDPNAPTTLTQSLPVPSGSTIYSGQVISPVWTAAVGSHAWTLGMTGGTPYIALQDSADEDVNEAGKLTGLSCAGQFEIQTSFYQGSDSGLTLGAILTAGATNGNVLLATPGTTSALGSTIVGFVSRVPFAPAGTVSATYGGVDITASYTGGSGSATGPGAVLYPGINSNVQVGTKVLNITTAYSGARA